MDQGEGAEVVRVLGCFDSFKDSLEADLVASAVLTALADLYPGIIFLIFNLLNNNCTPLRR
jgi:glycerate kinase